MIMIGLCGRPRTGKGQVRSVLESRCGFRWVDTKQPLVDAAIALTGLQRNEYTSQDGKDSEYKGIQLRKVMGEIGKSVEELFGENHLVNLAIERERNGCGPKTRLVFDALRRNQPIDFPGYVVEVVSDRGIDTGYDFDEYSKDKIDYTIYNNGSLGDLERNIIFMLHDLGIYVD